MGAMTNKGRNAAQHAKGKAKEAAGKVTGNRKLEAKGKSDQTKATVKKAGEKAGKQAEKKFDKTKADDALTEVVLKGKDAKPLKMPAYETKGVTPEQAGALVAQMRTLNP